MKTTNAITSRLINQGVNRVFLLRHILQQATYHPQYEAGKMLRFALETRELFLTSGQQRLHSELHKLLLPAELMYEDISGFAAGKLLQVEGKVQTVRFIDEEAVTRYRANVLVSKYQFFVG